MDKYVFLLILIVLTCLRGIHAAYGDEKAIFEAVEMTNNRNTGGEPGAFSGNEGKNLANEDEWNLLDEEEWKIFDEERERVSGVDKNEKAQVQGTWSYTGQWSLRATWQHQWENNTVFEPVVSKDPYYLSFIGEGEERIWRGEKLRLSISGGAEVTTEGQEEFKQKHSVDEKDIRYFTYMYPSFHELSAYYKFNDSISVEAGLLPTEIGNSLFLNPVNYLDRFTDDPLAIGAYTFCSTRLFFSRPRHTFSLTYFPALVKKEEESSYLSQVFHLGRTNNFVILQSNHYFWEGRLSLVGFLEERKAWTWGTPWWGIGFEAQFPLSSAILNVQSLWSTGEAISTLQELDGLPGEPFFLPDDDSLDECFGETFLMFTVPLVSRLELSVGYKYNERGLTFKEQEALFDTLKKTTNPNVLLSASGLGDSALSYVRHLGLITLSYPQLTKNSNISVLSFINLEDSSGELFGFYGLDIKDNMQMTLLGTLSFGSTDSLFGTNIHKTTFNVGFKIFF